MTSFKLIDRTKLDEDFAGDEDILKELVETFQGELPKMTASLSQAIAANDPKMIERTAHTLKGAVANFHAQEVKDVLFALEKMGHEGDIEKAKATWDQASKLIVMLQEELKTFNDHSAVA